MLRALNISNLKFDICTDLVRLYLYGWRTKIWIEVTCQYREQ
jgi:hypothetical protein